MGLMNRMRDKTHIILIVLVLAFLGTIIFQWGMDYLGSKGQQFLEFGSVNGDEINQNEFEKQVQAYAQQQKDQTGEDPDDATMQMIRQQVWENLVQTALVHQEAKRLGVKVTDQEVIDFVFQYPEQVIGQSAQQFRDSATGIFDVEKFRSALVNPENKQKVAEIENSVRERLLTLKVTSLVSASIIIPESDVRQKFKDDNIFASFDYIFLDLGQVPDGQVQVTDDDLKNYYEKNKSDFRTEESVKMRYILFSDNPTAEDSTVTEKQLRGLIKEFKRYPVTDTNFIQFVNNSSLTKFNDTTYFEPTKLSPEVVSFLMGAKKDSVSDVIKSNDGYHLIRFIDSKEGETVYTNASKIVVNLGADTNAAKAKADEIYKKLKSGEDFAKLASQLSDDQGSKVNGGNIGWFSKGTQLKELEEMTNKGKIGEIMGPEKIQGSYYIVKVNDRQKKQFKFADIKKVIKASTKTIDAIRKRADDFMSVATKGNFDEEAKKNNLQITEYPPLTKSQGMNQNPSLIKFAFGEKVGAVSQPLKTQGGYAVYTISSKTPAGFRNFEEIKDNALMPRVKNEKKLELLKQKAVEYRNKITGNNIQTIKNADPSVNFTSVDSFSVAKGNPQIGTDYDFDNALFKLANGQLSDPIKTQRGYYIVQMKSVTPFDESVYNTKSESIRQTLITSKKQAVLQQWIQDLKDKADIVDNRDRYYR